MFVVKFPWSASFSTDGHSMSLIVFPKLIVFILEKTKLLIPKGRAV